MQKITPFLSFDGNKAEEAMNFYVSIFKDSKILSLMRYGDAGPGPKGAVMAGTFQLNGQDFFALNGGPPGPFSASLSFFVTCEDQEELDYLWARLLAGGEAIQCGWLRDKYGLTWQIVPKMLGEMIQDKDVTRAARVMQAMMGMVKLDIAALQQAYDAA